VHEGELVSLIGSNGAGKTTTMKAITGILGANDGDIDWGPMMATSNTWGAASRGAAPGTWSRKAW